MQLTACLTCVLPAVCCACLGPTAPPACGETAKSTTINKSNAQHAILFEAISLILALDCSRDLLASSVNSLGRFLSVKVRGRQLMWPPVQAV